jgi:anti-sigma regulatory factor (Ser/Thr protein kinase)
MGARGSVSSRLRLAALPTAVPIGRHFAAVQARMWNLDGFAEDIAFVVSELVTNAVAATGRSETPDGHLALREHPVATILLRLRFTLARLFCEVCDSSPYPPLPAEADELGDLDETGRGLLLVAGHCADWGYYYPARGDGKIVWAAFDLESPEPRT